MLRIFVVAHNLCHRCGDTSGYGAFAVQGRAEYIVWMVLSPAGRTEWLYRCASVCLGCMICRRFMVLTRPFDLAGILFEPQLHLRWHGGGVFCRCIGISEQGGGDVVGTDDYAVFRGAEYVICSGDAVARRQSWRVHCGSAYF